MGLFGKIVKTTINTVALPVEAAKDVVTLGNFGDGSFTLDRIEKLKSEAIYDEEDFMKDLVEIIKDSK